MTGKQKRTLGLTNRQAGSMFIFMGLIMIVLLTFIEQYYLIPVAIFIVIISFDLGHHDFSNITKNENMVNWAGLIFLTIGFGLLSIQVYLESYYTMIVTVPLIVLSWMMLTGSLLEIGPKEEC